MQNPDAKMTPKERKRALREQIRRILRYWDERDSYYVRSGRAHDEDMKMVAEMEATIDSLGGDDEEEEDPW